MRRKPAPTRSSVARDVPGRVLLAGYRFAGLLARPAVPLLLSARVRRGKEDRARLNERHGRASTPPPGGRCVWVHAASVGETNTALPLIRRLVASGASVVLTTVTRTSAEIAARQLPAGAIHQYAPIDIGPFVRRFLDHWRPELLVLVETELWPATIRAAAARGVPVAVVNGRLSDRSFASWSRFPSVARALLRDVGLTLAQTPKDGERFARLGSADVRVTGNMKFDVPAPAVADRALQLVRDMAAGRRVWVAASTHEGEEAVAGGVHRRLVAEGLSALTVIVPRHPERAGAIQSALAADGFTVARRSRGEAVGAGTDVYLADTLGELGIFYAAAECAFVGGSLVEIGGHNPIEAAKLGVPVVHGPHVGNFTDIYRAFAERSAALAVEDAAGLGEAVARLMSSAPERRRLAEAAGRIVAAGTGALDRTQAALAGFAGWDSHAG